MFLLDDLQERGILSQFTNRKKLEKSLAANKGVYIGFDPSGESLHLGNLCQLLLLKRFEKAGLKPVIVLGGATGMIGDPSGKKSERQLLDHAVILHNKNKFHSQFKKYIDAPIVDNYDFYKDMNPLEFLRNAGKFLTVKYMIAKESVATRLEVGLSFTEFSYMLIQAWDFKCLYEQYDVSVQAGGSDQWGNITAGIDFITKVLGSENIACGLTMNLLVNENGEKFGKSEKGAIFLDPKLTLPYEMYQFLVNQTDTKVFDLLRCLTFLSSDEITHIKKNHEKTPSDRLAQKILAKEIVIFVHGQKEFDKCEKISNSLFNNKVQFLNKSDLLSLAKTIPCIEIKSFYNKKVSEILVETGVAKSKREVRELINSKSLLANGIAITSWDNYFDKNCLNLAGFVLLRKGKKNYFCLFPSL